MMKCCTSFLFLLLLSGCGRPAATLSDGQFDENGAGDSLYAVHIPISSEYLGGYPVLAVGNRVFIKNPGKLEKNFSVYLFSGDSLKMEGEFLSRGRGPCEMIIATISFDPKVRQLNMLANCNMEDRFCRVQLDSIDNLYDISKWKFRQLPFIAKNFFTESCLIEGSTCLMMGCSADSLNMFSVLDVDNERVTPLNYHYPSLPIELSPLDQIIFWIGRLYKQPDRKRFLYSANDFKYLFIFDIDEKNQIHIVRNIHDMIPKVQLKKNFDRPYSFDNSCERGCSQIAISDQRIYVAYSQVTHGQVRESVRTGGSSSSFNPTRINVYDWEGNFIRRLVLDVPVGPMVVVGNQLIARSTDPETAEEVFVRYSL